MRWILAFHIIFMVTWFSGLFYLPRLFVYHAMSKDTTSHDRFCIMERKLFLGIMTPGMLLTILFGLWLMLGYKIQGTWLDIKLCLVMVLVAYHFYCGRLMKDFRAGKNHHTHIYYRWLNEFPVLILIAVVLLAVVKPF
ncbi:MAG TPA: protoporphyrinogen oxidase HemJ [Burkholderiales bacterium]|nr:protoporphyrinogen oxidase HemJ [Burkholderiales bacterium]